MAGIEDLIGQFGGLMAPQPQAEPSQWERQLRDPATQAALLSFGLQALNGGWGNGAQQFAQAAGAGAQGGGTYTQQEQERTRYEQARQDQASNRAAERQTRLDVANIGAASRAEIAALRREAASARIDDRMAIATMYNRRAAEDALNRARTASMANLSSIPASRHPAEIERIERTYADGMARLRIQFPLATDAALPPIGGNALPAPSGAAPAAPAPTSRDPAPAAPAASSGPGFWSGFTQGAGAIPRPAQVPAVPPPAAQPGGTDMGNGITGSIVPQPPNPLPGQPSVQTHPISGQPIPALSDAVRAQVGQLVMRAIARDPQAAQSLQALMQDTTNPELQQFAITSYNAARQRR